MKSKKTMLILPVAVVALCAIALIGAGFAANYTGTTSNYENNTRATYITLSDGTGEYSGGFNGNIEYNSVNNNGTITYTPIFTGEIVDNDTYNTYESYGNSNEENERDTKVVELGTLTLTVNRIETNRAYSLEITDSTNNNLKETQNFYIGVNDKVIPYTSAFIANIENNVSDLKLTLYYKAVNVSGNDINTEPVKDVTFTFKATVTEINA